MRYKDRLEALKKRLQKERLDGLLITKSENIFYLCGFDGDASLIISRDRNFIITDSRYKEICQEKLQDFDLNLVDGSVYKVINDIVKRAKIKNLGFESQWLNYNQFFHLKKTLKKGKLIPKIGLIEDLRIIKDNDEIGLIKRSVSIVKEAYSYAKKMISPRLTGKDLAILIDNFMRSHGASSPAFQTIVAQNPYSSSPHGPATESSFGKDSSLLLDMGAVFKGYNSDLTRVIFIGRISTKFKGFYNILKAAQAKVIDRIRPKIRISELDKIARQYIINKGLGKYILHNLGHGIGLEIHEPPTISKKNKDILRPGMVFTIEPGIYIPGLGGLRLEDMILVTDKGYEVLTSDIPK